METFNCYFIYEKKFALSPRSIQNGVSINDNNHSSCTSKYRHENTGVCTLEVYRKVCNFLWSMYYYILWHGSISVIVFHCAVPS